MTETKETTEKALNQLRDNFKPDEGGHIRVRPSHRDNAYKRTVDIEIAKSFLKAYYTDDIIEAKAERSAEEEMFDMLYDLIEQNEWRLLLDVYMEMREEDATRKAYRSEYTQYRRRVSESMTSTIIYLMSKESIEYVEELIVMYKELATVIYDEVSHGQIDPTGARNLYDTLKNRPALKDLFSDIV